MGLLERMFDEQKRFNTNFVDFKNISEPDKVKWTKEYILHILSECDELLRETNWKIHRQEAVDNIIKSNLQEEIIDLVKYIFSIAILWDMDAKALFEEFERKSQVVAQRYAQEYSLKKITSEQIVGVDIDGILADYPFSFMQFVNKKMKTNFKREQIRDYDLKNNLGLTTEQYIQIKDEYRQSGQKRFIPLVLGSVDLLKLLKSQGYTIILLTSRPYKKYKRIFADTQEWLKKHKLIYDAILYDEDKDVRLIKEFGGQKVKFFIEDVLSNANKISDLGVKVFLVDKPYNQGAEAANVIRVKDLHAIFTFLITTSKEYFK